MTLDQNKAIAKRFIQEVFVQADEKAADELTAPDFVPTAGRAWSPASRA